MNDSEKEELIKRHARIKLTEIDVLRRLNLSESDCRDEGTIRRFCHANGRTLPDMIEIIVEGYAPTSKRSQMYEWHITVFENPNETEEVQ